MKDEQCCTHCGATEGVIEYHMAGYELNRDDYSNLPEYGGVDYPVEYCWCNNCDRETFVEPHENWCERTAEEEDEDEPESNEPLQ